MPEYTQRGIAAESKSTYSSSKRLRFIMLVFGNVTGTVLHPRQHYSPLAMILTAQTGTVQISVRGLRPRHSMRQQVDRQRIDIALIVTEMESPVNHCRALHNQTISFTVFSKAVTALRMAWVARPPTLALISPTPQSPPRRVPPTLSRLYNGQNLGDGRGCFQREALHSERYTPSLTLPRATGERNPPTRRG
ncbi:MAG: hypothetical protein HW388_1087 [Dehalococcoidia bacterium]|nr:hypothetical protein [Dehalococcoidia bacterium]